MFSPVAFKSGNYGFLGLVLKLLRLRALVAPMLIRAYRDFKGYVVDADLYAVLWVRGSGSRTGSTFNGLSTTRVLNVIPTLSVVMITSLTALYMMD